MSRFWTLSFDWQALVAFAVQIFFYFLFRVDPSQTQLFTVCLSLLKPADRHHMRLPMKTEPRRAPPCEISSAFNETFSSTIIRLFIKQICSVVWGESEPREFIRKSIHRKTREISPFYSEYEVRGIIPDWFWCRLTDRDKTAAYYLDKKEQDE